MGFLRSLRRAVPKSCFGQIALIAVLILSLMYLGPPMKILGQSNGKQDEIPPFLESTYRRQRKPVDPRIMVKDPAENLVIRARDMEIRNDSLKTNPDKIPKADVSAFDAPSGWQRFKDDGTPKVIILAYYRSGSTLAGSIFSTNPQALYSFEPLHGLYQSSIKYGQSLRYYNGSVVLPPSFGHEIPFVHEVLGAYLTCDFSKIDIGSLSYGLASMSSQHLQNNLRCHSGHKKNITYLRDICLRQVREDCMKADVRAIKEIRLSMETMDFMLEQIPSLKIIHLLRDSRGIICSQAYEKSCTRNKGDIQQFCAKLNVDIERRLVLQKKYPGRVKLIKYEALAVNPIAVARNVYKFLERKLPRVVAQWLYENTMTGMKSRGNMDAVRSDSIITAYKWSKNIDWDIARQIQKHCKYPLKHGKYPFYSSEARLREAKIPKRPKSARHWNVTS